MNSFYQQVVLRLNEAGVRYLIVGGFAVNFHGYNRSTADLDVWIDIEDSNLSKLGVALQSLGFEFDEEERRRLANEKMISFSEDEHTVELMPRMNISQQTSFDMAYDRADKRSIDGLNYSIISLTDLINKKARSKRYKDLDDLSKLEEAAAYYKRKSKEK